MTLEINKRVEFDAPIEAVWKAITDPRELGCLVSRQRAPTSRPRPAMKAGSNGRLDDSECGGGTFAVKVEKAEPFHTLVWSWSREKRVFRSTRQASTRVEWKLSERADGGHRARAAGNRLRNAEGP